VNNLHITTFYKLHNKLSCESRLSLSSCRASRAVLFDKLDTAKMHGLERRTCRVQTWRAKWNLSYRLQKRRHSVRVQGYLQFRKHGTTPLVFERLSVCPRTIGQTFTFRMIQFDIISRCQLSGPEIIPPIRPYSASRWPGVQDRRHLSSEAVSETPSASDDRYVANDSASDDRSNQRPSTPVQGTFLPCEYSRPHPLIHYALACEKFLDGTSAHKAVQNIVLSHVSGTVFSLV